jgi:hypothetical protein
MIDYTKKEVSFCIKMEFNWHYIADTGEVLFFMTKGFAHEAFIFG